MVLFGECLFGDLLFGADQICETSTLLITPDLGWANRDAMFLGGSINPKLVGFPLITLVPSTKTPTYVKGRFSLVFNILDMTLELPEDAIGLLGGSGRHFFKFDDGEVQEFELELAPSGVAGSVITRA